VIVEEIDDDHHHVAKKQKKTSVNESITTVEEMDGVDMPSTSQPSRSLFSQSAEVIEPDDDTGSLMADYTGYPVSSTATSPTLSLPTFNFSMPAAEADARRPMSFTFSSSKAAVLAATSFGWAVASVTPAPTSSGPVVTQASPQVSPSAPATVSVSVPPTRVTPTDPPMWLWLATRWMKSKYPDDTFFLKRIDGNEWRIKCSDCPGKVDFHYSHY
jgi:hypothetical protein